MSKTAEAGHGHEGHTHGDKHGTVIVTGASRGIGAAIATELGEAGYGVAVNYSSHEEPAEEVAAAIRAHGGRASAIHADVSVPDEVAELFERAERELGPVTALVNNAGTTGAPTPFDLQEPAKLSELLAINVLGPMVCARHAVEKMATSHGGRGGSIVNIASVAARTGGLPGLVPYAATKGAMVSFSRALSNEVASEGIRVNSVSPGIIDTDMSADLDSPETKEAVAHSPIGRLGRPEEIADTVTWLISPAASFVTGSDITVSGGR
ncbi:MULTISPECIES: glucose 1-dehydrogenase [unclassified Streptomyces]|uniref:SDR family NAD(P)-dependent oxidoreductase n=1 Tax=unclassified Streptomyces TaxID=2593676 RepID=UPI00081E029A|nr:MULTISPECIES: glucose 1-dehydrogenase [unclassified Streptomyces]MYZ34428.1 glucose 1-dehydrogenase [Streptomyces sp. SID4917]SCF67321.1 NAD(P)-dependent dehydrogenase, short-chain alcohol dehydrogenase family [Streptomyces sp. MnatMP-M17]